CADLRPLPALPGDRRRLPRRGRRGRAPPAARRRPEARLEDGAGDARQARARLRRAHGRQAPGPLTAAALPICAIARGATNLHLGIAPGAVSIAADAPDATTCAAKR